MIRIEGVSKSYQGKSALVKADLNLEKGKVVGLLGPNGSGKTTLLRILTGELRADEGHITLDGVPLSWQTKQAVAGLTRSDFLPESLTLAQAARTVEGFFADFDPARFAELLAELDLLPDMKIQSLSKGMRSKFALALTVSRHARLIILDEPLDGVDPVAREEILSLIRAGFSPQSTLLVTSHLIHELERLLDEVYFIREGAIRYMGDAKALREGHQMSLDELYREVYRR